MRKNKGITLIALIITIIILLILTGVSINLLIKGDLFGSAEKAVKGTNAKVEEQQGIVDDLMNEFDEIERDFCSHIWKEGNIITQPTCTAPGKKQMICEKCGKIVELELSALGHNFVNRVCTRCGETETGCTNHTYGPWEIIKQPTCIQEGTKKRICTVCGIEQIEKIPATGQHNYVNGKCTMCQQGLEIGAKINYHEYLGTNGSTVFASYTSTTVARGSSRSTDSNAVYSVVNNSGIEWIVLGDENGQIKITTKDIVQPTSGGYNSNQIKYMLFGAKQESYANFVNELNNASAVYGKGKYADSSKYNITGIGATGGRSFTMEDLGYTKSRVATYKYVKSGISLEQFNIRTEQSLVNTGDNKPFYFMSLDANTSMAETEQGHQWNELGNQETVTIYDYKYSGSKTLPTTVVKANAEYGLASRYIRHSKTITAYYDIYYIDSNGSEAYVDLYSSNPADASTTAQDTRTSIFFWRSSSGIFAIKYKIII